jgi:hypothetical protein
MNPTDALGAQSPTPGVRNPGVTDGGSKAKLKKAVKEFESLFVGYMLKTMRGTVPKNEDAGTGFGADMLEGMFDLELARHVSQNSSLGLGEMLYTQMTGDHLPPPVSHGTAHTPTRHDAVPRKIFSPIPPPIGRPIPPPIGRPVAAPIALPVPVQVAPASPATTKVPPSVHRIAAGSGAVQSAPPDSVRRRIDGYNDVIQEAAGQHAVDANLIKAVIAAESAGKADARSGKNAKGLMQLADTTAADMGVKNVWEPRENVLGGAKYLKQMLDRHDGDLNLALASYNAGPGAVEKYDGVPPFEETRAYLKKVLGYLHVFQQGGDVQ